MPQIFQSLFAGALLCFASTSALGSETGFCGPFGHAENKREANAGVLAMSNTNGSNTSDQVAAKPTVSLSITGDPGARFTADCSLTGGAGGSQTIDGQVPTSFEFDATGISCRITSTQTITVELSNSRGNRTRSTTSGGTINLSIQ